MTWILEKMEDKILSLHHRVSNEYVYTIDMDRKDGDEEKQNMSLTGMECDYGRGQ